MSRSGSGPGPGRCFPVFPKVDKPYGQALTGLRVQAPLGARVLSFVCCASNDGFGPQSGLVQRGVLYAAAWGSENRTTALTGEEMHPFWWLAPPPSPRRGDFILRYALALFCPRLRGKSGAAGKGEASAASQSAELFSYHMTQKSKSRNVLASPLGEEGHEVAKGVQANWIHRGEKRPANPVRRHPAKSVWTRVRMIMTLDVDVTADWRSGPRCSILSVLCLVHPFPLRGISPQGETRDMERKTGESYTSCTIPVFPPLVAGATTLPGGKHVI